MTLADSYDDLERHLIGDEAELPEVLSDLSEVERTIRAIAWRRRKIAQAEVVTQAVIDRAREHLEEERKRFDPSWLEERLRGYHAARLADDPKAKTLRFPSGDLVARQGQPRWQIDSDTFVSWALANRGDHLLRVKHEPDRSEIKKALSVDGSNAVSDEGEVVPGVVVEPAEVNYSVKVEQ